MYEDTLKRINNQTEEEVAIAKMALMWAARARRPLFLQEMQDAIATSCSAGSLVIGEYDGDGIPEGDLILSACCGLLVVDRSFEQVTLIRESL